MVPPQKEKGWKEDGFRRPNLFRQSPQSIDGTVECSISSIDGENVYPFIDNQPLSRPRELPIHAGSLPFAVDSERPVTERAAGIHPACPRLAGCEEVRGAPDFWRSDAEHTASALPVAGDRGPP